MQLAERHIIKSTEHRFAPIDQLAFQSKNLYNIENYLHHASRRIINLLSSRKIGTLVIGKNVQWKKRQDGSVKDNCIENVGFFS
jgi:hypothetical protein